MRKIRNPRYAPEFLERKLSPSAMIATVPVTSQVYTLAGDPPPPPPPDGLPPVPPTGPPGPA
jgi:hypothetical protein